MKYIKNAFVLTLAVLLCLSVCACGTREKAPEPTAPSRADKPILPGIGNQQPSSNDYTAVYVSVYGELAILASYPVLEYQGEKPECPPRELSDGGSILCGGDHEDEKPITRVLITGELVPKSMNGWFRNMASLEQIDGLEKLRTHHVTDMSHLFAGCKKLAQLSIDGWDVSAVTDATGIFDGCDALSQLPAWYPLEDNGSLG